MQFKRVGIVDEPLEVRLKPGIHGLDYRVKRERCNGYEVRQRYFKSEE
jgi:hypothetical protein